jgi:hypothetical protein
MFSAEFFFENISPRRKVNFENVFVLIMGEFANSSK